MVAWGVAGTYFEACNCEAICPCRSVSGRPGGRSTHGVCQFALSWHITDGHAGDVGLADLDVVLAGFYRDDDPGSPWDINLYLDERADPAQTDWLSRIFRGQAGGDTRANFAAAIATVRAVKTARIELDHRPAQWSIGVDRFVRVRATQTVPGEETVTCGIPGYDRPGQELVAEVMSVDDEPLVWDVQGRCAFTTDFEYHSDPGDD